MRWKTVPQMSGCNSMLTAVKQYDHYRQHSVVKPSVCSVMSCVQGRCRGLKVVPSCSQNTTYSLLRTLLLPDVSCSHNTPRKTEPLKFSHLEWCPPISPNPISPNPISPNPNSPNPYMLGLGIGLGSGFDYFRQYNVIRRIGIRRDGAEPLE